MKKLLLAGFLCLTLINVRCQILNDSTAQVVAYWNKGDKQQYMLTHEQLVIKDADTLSRTFHKYDIDITIIDSTATSYTSNWFYHNYEVQAGNEIAKLLSTLNNDLNVQVVTNEMGVFQEIKNWKEVRDFILKGTKQLKKQLTSIPNSDKIIAQIEAMYSTKESI
ncbi:MAG: hypothetical protein LBR55_00560, partial [Bacteroidales bacterium]|nr:hypothetical protein [Bacteroidales bacterium]